MSRLMIELKPQVHLEFQGFGKMSLLAASQYISNTFPMSPAMRGQSSITTPISFTCTREVQSILALPTYTSEASITKTPTFLVHNDHLRVKYPVSNELLEIKRPDLRNTINCQLRRILIRKIAVGFVLTSETHKNLPEQCEW